MSTPDSDDAAARAALEKFRQSGISLDREGRFWHEGEEVTHAGLKRAFHRWIDRLADGRYVLRLDEKRYVYLDVEDAPVVVRSLHWQGDRVFATLPDGSEEELDYGSLRLSQLGAAYTRVRGGRLEARLAPSAWNVLMRAVSDDGAGPCLEAARQRWPIAIG